ncbi:IucA/IucC family protein [Herbaspirillum rubrisubalbicans]|uniref:IucA/IucC family siderophore biosynthesis protein n=1 Tax=Herbaspirillum rubrisubalbicans Os34 TaxID=1235827 RepID=A0A6M3ZY53_9BURK|nr:IucA/IucC family protein [Herbaspirillum rubrisubalbicans]QJQ03497.1 IucA/IucC family siderophore biosynthesis protein [Herbaspirillum rubrisubalbicans Os34]
MSPFRYCDLIASPAYARASERVVRQLVEALLFEQAFTGARWQDGTLQLAGQDRHGQAVRYHAPALTTFSFGRIRLTAPVQRTDASGLTTAARDPAQLLAELAGQLPADALRLQQFAAELLATQIKDAQTLHARQGEVLREQSYDWIEARLTGSHPYHPSYKSRLGFTLADNAAYAPETAAAVHPILLAVQRTAARAALAQDMHAMSPRHDGPLLAPQDQQAWYAELEKRGLAPQDYLPLPVHPWQWEEIIAPTCHTALATGELQWLGPMRQGFLPQQSIRTLASLDDPARACLKLSMNLVNTSTSRVLAPHTVMNAAPISDWLQALVQASAWPAPMRAPVLLREFAGISYTSATPVAGQYGALACIWRESIHPHLAPNEQAVPMTALLHIDGDGRPFIDPWIARHGLQAWLQALLERAWLPVLHLLWSQGVALESHAQNMLLLHEQGWPQRVALKDFHDGVRFSTALLQGPPPALTAPPAEHVRINPNSFLHTDDAAELRDFCFDALFFVNLAELAWLLDRYYALPQAQFWQITARVLLDYQQQHPELAARFALFDCFAPEVDIEMLASRRFQPEIRLRTRAVANPLAQARQALEPT